MPTRFRQRGTPSVREVADSFGRGQQAERVTELKCLHRSPKGDRAARKGISGLLPGVESWSSEERVSDGMLKPNPEGSLHYCLLLGDGDINDRGEGDEGSNTPVCRPRGVQKTLKRGPSPSQDRTCAKTDFEIRSVRLSAKDTALSRRRDGFDSHTGCSHSERREVWYRGRRGDRTQVRILPF